LRDLAIMTIDHAFLTGSLSFAVQQFFDKAEGRRAGAMP